MPLEFLGGEEPERARGAQYVRLGRLDLGHGWIDQSRARVLVLARREALLPVALAEGPLADFGRPLALHDVHELHEVGGDFVLELAGQAGLPLDLHHGGSRGRGLDRRRRLLKVAAVELHVEVGGAKAIPSSAGGSRPAHHREQALAQLVIFEYRNVARRVEPGRFRLVLAGAEECGADRYDCIVDLLKLLAMLQRLREVPLDRLLPEARLRTNA